MTTTVYNPQKGRLETIHIEFTKQNTTWFVQYRSNRDIRMITDFDGGILISEYDYTYPVWIYDISRKDIGYNQKKARQLRADMTEACR
jgi:hypothetical protein